MLILIKNAKQQKASQYFLENSVTETYAQVHVTMLHVCKRANFRKAFVLIQNLR